MNLRVTSLLIAASFLSGCAGITGSSNHSKVEEAIRQGFFDKGGGEEIYQICLRAHDTLGNRLPAYRSARVVQDSVFYPRLNSESDFAPSISVDVNSVNAKPATEIVVFGTSLGTVAETIYFGNVTVSGRIYCPLVFQNSSDTYIGQGNRATSFVVDAFPVSFTFTGDVMLYSPLPSPDEIHPDWDILAYSRVELVPNAEEDLETKWFENQSLRFETTIPNSEF